jgi:ribonucleoside-diphosphate reductase alpha chain
MSMLEDTYSENAVNIYKKLYLIKDKDDIPIETIEECHLRVTNALGLTNRHKKALDEQAIRVNTPCMANAGCNDDECYAACFILDLEDSMDSIIESWTIAPKIYKAGGGCGFPFSNLREKEAYVGSGGYASGPLSYMQVIQTQSETVKSGGRNRRAANKVDFRYNHPDILEFINCKQNKKDFKAFNLSVLVDNDFFVLLDLDTYVDLISPKDGSVINSIRASEIWEAIIDNAWETADPGLMFYDRINQDNPFPSINSIVCSNPCQPADALLLDKDRLRRIDDPNAQSWQSWCTGEKDVYKVKTNIGLEFRCTKDHEIIMYDESKMPAIESKGKKIKHPFDYVPPFIKTKKNSKEIVRGFLFGDGFSCGGGYGVSVKIDFDKENAIVELLKKYGMYEQSNSYLYINKDKLMMVMDCSFIGTSTLEKELPLDIMQGPKNKVSNFLRGLFEANGSCNINGQISFKTISHKLAKQVQLLLLSFGIHASISTNDPTKVDWPNGTYTSKESYNVQVSPSYGDIFKQSIGFVSKYKNEKIKKTASKTKSKIIVTDIEYVGKEMVWDYRMKTPPHHNFCQGAILANCGEIVGPPWTVCMLAHINLNKCLDKATNTFNWKKLKEYIHIASDFLNQMINKSPYPHQYFKDRMMQDRPIGIGIMGFADILYKMGIPYDSKKARDFLEEIQCEITKTAYEYAIDNVGRFGKVTIPKKDEDHFREILTRFNVSPYYIERAIEGGIANSTVTTIAPTGSTSISADCSYAFEPQFALVFEKYLADTDETWHFVNPIFEKACTEHVIDVDLYLDDIKNNNGSIRGLDVFPKQIQDVFVTAHDISWEDRLEMQAAAQHGTTMSISSTINLPESATKEDISNIYKTAWKKGLKGVTVYRDGCLDEQPISFGSKKEKSEEMPMSVELRSKLERPDVLHGTTTKLKTGSGTLYLTVNHYEGEPFEVFATIGKGGKSIAAKAEAIGRMVSLALRSGVSIDEIVRQLEGIGGDYQIFQNGGLVKSIPDAIAKVLQTYSETKGKEFIHIKPVTVGEMKEKICPSCGQPTFVKDGACRGGRCVSCGFSNCQ